jgi:trk system potassium uptake protein TrkH
MLVVCCTTFLLCILEPGLPFISLLFEAVSAYSTAGLSTGITAQICLPAKLVLIFTMYTGRVGAFTLLSLWVERPEPNAHFTEEAITIG